MKVEKYCKKKEGKYRVSFSNGKEMDLYEEVILKHELLISKEIEINKLLKIIEDNQEYDVYYTALKLLKVKARSKKEIEEVLKKKEYPHPLIQKALKKLEDQRYLDDEVYASAYVNQQIVTTTHGPNKIRYELEKKGISKEIIEKVITVFDQKTEQEKITKIINRLIQNNRNKSSLMLRKKIEQELLYQGFNRRNIEEVLENTKMPKEKDIYQKEYQKLYQKLSKKYSGETLNYYIRQKLYQKGFRMEDE